MLVSYAAPKWNGRSVRLGDRVAPILAEWAVRRGAAEVVRLSSSQLYAVISGPVLAGAKVVGGLVAAESAGLATGSTF